MEKKILRLLEKEELTVEAIAVILKMDQKKVFKVVQALYNADKIDGVNRIVWLWRKK